MKLDPSSTEPPGTAPGSYPADSDGYHLTSAEVARAAGVSRKEVRRAIKAAAETDPEISPAKAGGVLTFDKAHVPTANLTREAAIREVCQRLGIGRFSIKQKMAQRDEERRMSAQQHAWNLGTHGRHVGSKQSGGVIATLTCERCPTVEVIEFRQLAGPDAMDRKFIQKGWAVDPARCPEHNRRNHQHRKGDSMAGTLTAPSPAAIAAQAKMFGLLQTHFDPEQGVYGSSYSDARVAEECRLSVELVAGVRAQAFGQLKVPPEVQSLQDDLKALEDLVNESVGTLQGQVSALRARVAEVARKFPI